MANLSVTKAVAYAVVKPHDLQVIKAIGYAVVKEIQNKIVMVFIYQ